VTFAGTISIDVHDLNDANAVEAAIIAAHEEIKDY